MSAKRFRDPIHGFIEVDLLESKIIDSEPFQRLRYIRQLGTSYLVYHGAEHTRFGHSLGVMHLVSKAFDSALFNYEMRNGKKLFDDETHQFYKRILRLYALVHDVGHPPFSHAGEGVFANGLKHEHFTKRMLHETQISSIINESGDITPELIWLIFGAKDTEIIGNDEYKLPDYKFLKSFMDSDLDCDKMDYLLRDSYYCGVNYGRYDVNRLVESLNVYTENNIMQLAVERGGLHAFEEFVSARYFMFIQVYFHRTRRYFDYVLTSLLKETLGKQITSDFPLDSYLNRTDGYVFNEIRALKDSKNEHAINFCNRTVFPCVYETPSQSTTADRESFNLIHNSIKKQFSGMHIFDDSADKLATEMPIIEHFNSDDGKSIPILTKHSTVPRSLLSESNLLSGLNRPISIRRIYVEQTNADKVKKYIQDISSPLEE